ncbi:MAG: sulfite exporter TauE/SafE family protein [Pseudomonadota bacterium]
MQALLDAFQSSFFAFWDHPALIPVLMAVSLAGIVRGFAGFGGAMVFMPFATFLFEPRLVVVAFFMIDTSVTIPLLRSGFRHWDWRTVIPCALGSWLSVGLGAYLLANTDTQVLRWVICGIIIVLVAFMMSGWRYTARPRPPVSLAVGSVSGILGGISQVSAPPLVAYWSAGPFPAETIRANLICFFFFATLGSLVAFSANGVFSAQSVALAFWLAPAYGLAIFIGARLFKGTDDSLFRKVAFGLILIAAVTSLPALDSILRS